MPRRAAVTCGCGLYVVGSLGYVTIMVIYMWAMWVWEKDVFQHLVDVPVSNRKDAQIIIVPFVIRGVGFMVFVSLGFINIAYSQISRGVPDWMCASALIGGGTLLVGELISTVVQKFCFTDTQTDNRVVAICSLSAFLAAWLMTTYFPDAPKLMTMACFRRLCFWLPSFETDETDRGNVADEEHELTNVGNDAKNDTVNTRNTRNSNNGRDGDDSRNDGDNKNRDSDVRNNERGEENFHDAIDADDDDGNVGHVMNSQQQAEATATEDSFQSTHSRPLTREEKDERFYKAMERMAGKEFADELRRELEIEVNENKFRRELESDVSDNDFSESDGETVVWV